nr:uncharacterized protein LOC127304385 [Lolium perenne]
MVAFYIFAGTEMLFSFFLSYGSTSSANAAITLCCYLRLELLAGERNAASLHLRCLRAWPSLSGLEAIKCSTSPSLIRSNQQRIWYLCLFKQTLLLFGEKTRISVATSVRPVSISLARLSAPWASSLVASASSRIGLRSGVVRYDKFSGCSSASFNRYEDMFDEDDASKVTLPAWPGQGYGRHRLSSGLLVQFVSCPYSDVFDLL